MSIGKGIQIFLPDGNPKGVKIIEIPDSICKGIFFPRANISDIKKRPEINNIGLYFLFGEKDDIGKQNVYVGEAENLFVRIKQHINDSNKEKSKDWDSAVVFFSEKENLNKAHIKYLESLSYDKIKDANKSILMNANTPTMSKLTEFDESFVNSFFIDLKLMLSTLGFSIFEKLDIMLNSKRYYLKTKSAEGVGIYSEEGFTVIKGSKAVKDEMNSIGKSLSRMRENLINNNVLTDKNEYLEFSTDFTFPSVSAAAATIIGGNANGWKLWKDESGITIDENERINTNTS